LARDRLAKPILTVADHALSLLRQKNEAVVVAPSPLEGEGSSVVSVTKKG